MRNEMNNAPAGTAVKVSLSADYNYLAPDGSEIRLLVRGTGGSLAHCVLRGGEVTTAIRHRTVEELWYVIEGAGEIWSARGDRERIDELRPGDSISIPAGVSFQFRAFTGTDLKLLITTIPPWPGADEALPTEGTWPAGSGAE